MINLFEPKIENGAVQLISEVFESKWLGRGTYVADFERGLYEFTGLKIRTLSCASDAIFGILKVLSFKPGSEIIIPTNSFPAIISAIIEANLVPVIVDIDRNGNVCTESVLAAVGHNTSAIFVTHYGGTPVDVELLRRNIPLNVRIFEDSACAFGTFTMMGHVGVNSDFSLYSFDPMKLLTTGEGGGFTTKDDELFEILNSYFYLGLPSKEKSGLDASAEKDRWWEYDLERTGVRSVFTNLNAAIGLSQLPGLHRSLERKEEIYMRYKSELRNIEILDSGRDGLQGHSNYFFTIYSERRDQLAKALLTNGIYSSLRYSSLGDMSLFRKFVSGSLTKANLFYRGALNIPIHSNLSDRDVDQIISVINEF